MISFDPVLTREIPLIRKIIADETWLEGERRGCRVAPDDRAVRENVCRVILQVGQQLRDSITTDLRLHERAAEASITTSPRPASSPALDWEI